MNVTSFNSCKYLEYLYQLMLGIPRTHARTHARIHARSHTSRSDPPPQGVPMESYGVLAWRPSMELPATYQHSSEHGITWNSEHGIPSMEVLAMHVSFQCKRPDLLFWPVSILVFMLVFIVVFILVFYPSFHPNFHPRTSQDLPGPPRTSQEVP